MNPELEQLTQWVLGALVNGLYQGLLLAAVLWLGLKLFRGTNAATRHAAGFLVLLIVAGLPVVHLLVPLRASRPASNMPSENVSMAPVNSEAIAFHDLPVRMRGGSSLPELAVDDMSSPSAEPGLISETGLDLPSLEAPEIHPGAEAMGRDRLPGLRASIVGAETIAGPAPVKPSAASIKLPSVYLWRAEVPELVSASFLLLVGVVAGARLLRLGWQWLALLRLKHGAASPSWELVERFEAVRRELNPGRPVRLLVGARITTPMVVGYFRPAVLLPAAIASGPTGRGIEGILRHELAHVHRRDDWCNLLQQVIAAIHFFNPAVVWLSRRLTIDREIACDDFALARSVSRRDYALLLTEFAGRNRNREWIAAPAAWSNRSQLKERINMILDPNRNTSRRLSRTSVGALTVATLGIAIVALIAGPRLVLAASADADSTPRSVSTAGVTLVSPAGDELIAHVDDATPVGVTVSASSDVEWNADHNVSHAIAVGRGPGVVISARPTIKVVPGATITVPGSSGVIVAHSSPPEPTQPADARPPKAPKPGRVPRAIPAPAAPPPEKSDESMEQRLERLERMIEQLIGSGRRFHFELQPGKEMELEGFEWHDRLPPPGEPFGLEVPSSGQHWPMDEAQRKAVEDSVKAAEKQMERAMKEAHREVARANEAVERTLRDAELRAQLEMKKEFGRTIKDADIQRKALADQRRSIEREMENLERQRERLQQQIERLGDQMERLEEQAEVSDEREEPGDEQDAPPRVKEKAEKN